MYWVLAFNWSEKSSFETTGKRFADLDRCVQLVMGKWESSLPTASVFLVADETGSLGKREEGVQVGNLKNEGKWRSCCGKWVNLPLTHDIKFPRWSTMNLWRCQNIHLFAFSPSFDYFPVVKVVKEDIVEFNYGCMILKSLQFIFFSNVFYHFSRISLFSIS